MPAPRKRQAESMAGASVDWLGQLLQMDPTVEDGFQIGADPPSDKQLNVDPPNCGCDNCKPRSEAFWDLEKLEGLLDGDYDFAPELEELLRDPLLGDAPGFEGFVDKQAAGVPRPPEGQSSASSAEHHTESSMRECANSAASNRTATGGAAAAQPASAPSASSSGGLGRTEAQERADHGTSTSSKSPAPSTEESGGEEQRKRARMMRNRESASLSRQRKKMQTEEKENQYLELQRHCASLNAAAVHLSQENAVLRQALTSICQQTGQPFPPALMAHPPLLPLHGLGSGLAMHPGVPPAPLQKVPIQRMDAPRPAPAIEERQTSGAQSKKPAKRRKQAIAGGSTALAALFCLFIYCGTGVPRVGDPIGEVKQQAVIQPRAIASGTYDPAGQVHSGGRSLQAAILGEGMQEDTGDHLNNSSYSEVILNPRDFESEERALQHLKDVAPFAVLSTYDSLTERYLAPAPWKSFSALAESALVPDGLVSPAVCKPVFDFDMGRIDNPQAAKQQLQQYLATMDMFKGRYRAMPLPPVHSMIPAIDESVGTEGDSHANMSCRDESDYVISVMLPSKEQAESGFTQLDKVYVVVLKPNKRYTMYSCELPRSIFV